MGIMEKKMEITMIMGSYKANIGIMEKKMETTMIMGLYRGNFGIMEKKMETAMILGLYGDNEKEHGNYYLVSNNVGCRRTLPRIEGAILGLYWGNLGIMEKKGKVL